MISILKTELFRLKKSTAFWVMFFVNIGLAIIGALLILAMEAVFRTTGYGSILEALGLAYTATSMLSTFASFSSNSSILALICTAIFLGREFSKGTIRNAVLANKNRKDIFLSYFLITLLISTVYFITEFVLTTLLYGLMIGFGNEPAGTVVSQIFIYFALGICSLLFAQTCVCMFLFATRKQSLTIVLPLLICLLAPGLLSSIIGTIVQSVEIATDKVISETALQCLPFYNINMLNPSNPDGLTVGMIALYDLLFAGGFFAAGYFPFQKADLK